MRLTRDDVLKIMEARTVPLKITKRGNERTTIAGRLPEGDYAALRAQRTKQGRRELRPREKPKSGNVVSMAPRQS
jgi:hypothetical protein